MRYFLLLFFIFLMLFAFVQRGRVRFFPGFLIIASILAMFFVLNPDYATRIANQLGVGRGSDLLLYFFVMAGLIVFVFMGVAIKKLSDNLTELARYIAIKEAYKNTSE